MRKLFGILSILVTVGAQAQVQAHAWNLSEVRGKELTVVGYIYHSSAVGTQIGTKATKAITGLRLVCSTKSNEAAIAIYWNGMFGNTQQTVDVKIDGRKISQTIPWQQDGPILFKDLFIEKELIQGLKTGRNINFEWVQGSVKRVTTISLQDFNQNFGDFKNSCNIQL